jgi:type I site-specific restriction endonuclease
MILPVIAIATGTGKTFVASSLMYRLLKSKFAKMVGACC